MHMKVPNLSGNSFVGGGDQSYDDHDQTTNSDYDDVLEFSSEGEGASASNDFSDFLWMENEELFETEVYASLEEQELMNECLEAHLGLEVHLGEIALLNEIREVEAEQFIE
jgi:hypothetical protein